MLAFEKLFIADKSDKGHPNARTLSTYFVTIDFQINRKGI